jgi:GT2 family glycosyltransferase
VFVPYDPAVRIQVGVCALGTPERLRAALEALVAHESGHDFTVACLVNPLTVSPQPMTVDVPAGVRVVHTEGNLGWAGGLHRLRALSSDPAFEYFVWAQDDMVPLPGWLDALVEVADARPSVGMLGAVVVDADGAVQLHNGGLTDPPGEVAGWSSTDRTDESLPDEVTDLDWVTSRGCLTRTSAFDDVGGPDPRLWPLNRVDLEFSTHLRCHGWSVALVPASRVRHERSSSAPSPLRTFLLHWRDGWFDEQWAEAVTALGSGNVGHVDHPCGQWRDITVDAVEGSAGREASKMLVPYAREHDRERRRVEAELSDEIDRLRATVAELELRLAGSHELERRLRARLRRQRARLRRAESPTPRGLRRLVSRVRR